MLGQLSSIGPATHCVIASLLVAMEDTVEATVVVPAGDEDDDQDDSDGDLDFGAVADRAVVAAMGRSVPELPELGLDVGISGDRLYLASRGRTAAFDTSTPPGVCTLDFRDFAEGGEHAPPTPGPCEREVRGAPVRPVDDKKLRNAEARKRREEHLDGWFGLMKRQLTPDMEKELRAIKLRANFDPKRFYKGNDSKELPKHFAFATVVGGGLAPAGEAPTVRDRHPLSGRSFLDSILKDEKAQEWTRKKYDEVGVRGMASAQSGHGKTRGKKAKSARRGGAWKTKKKRR